MATEFNTSWVRRFQAGDQRAFEALVRAWDRRLFALALRISGDRHAAEDIRQEAWVRCHLKLPMLRQPDRFPAWIARVVVNLCRDQARVQGRASRQPRVVAVDAMTPLASCEAAEARELAQSALRQLPPLEREVVALRVVQELSFDEIAELVSRPRSTVQLIYCRSLSVLARAVREDRTQPAPSRSPHAL